MTNTEGPRGVPGPAVMPVDREEWARQLNLSNFVNSYHQYRDLQRLPRCRRLLIIGPDQGLDTQVLRWRGYEVTTLDIDETFSPDVVGSVHDLRMFDGTQFDAVIASHVLEHFAEPYLDDAVGEIPRVGRYALIYLPVRGLCLHFRFSSNLRGLDLSGIPNPLPSLRTPDGLSARYGEGQHFWEVGMRGLTVSALSRRMRRFLDVVSVYRNRDWTPSRNWILKSRNRLAGEDKL